MDCRIRPGNEAAPRQAPFLFLSTSLGHLDENHPDKPLSLDLNEEDEKEIIAVKAHQADLTFRLGSGPKTVDGLLEAQVEIARSLHAPEAGLVVTRIVRRVTRPGPCYRLLWLPLRTLDELTWRFLQVRARCNPHRPGAQCIGGLPRDSFSSPKSIEIRLKSRGAAGWPLTLPKAPVSFRHLLPGSIGLCRL